MSDELLFDGPEVSRKYSRFWILLVLSAVIASAGIVVDSTATVIGAMIIAPLMTPILGTVFSIESGDGKNFVRCFLLVVSGAAIVIAIGWMFGQLAPVDLTADTNSQIAGRVHPRIADLVAALATGAVGAFAVSRSDVSDTLPGVAIAISLVPPLAVVGITFEAGAGDESLGALLLFLTNVGAILLSGLVVMSMFRVFDFAARERSGLSLGFHGAQLAVVVFVVALTVPLGAATVETTGERLEAGDVQGVAQVWAEAAGWRIVAVEVDEDGVAVNAAGPLPAPDPEELRSALDEKGLESVGVKLTLVPETRIDLPGD